MTSSDLRTWVARERYDPGAPLNEDPYFNDALPYPARWGGDVGGGRMTKEVWAPGIERFEGGYVVFYSIRMPPTQQHPERFCISRATSSSPQGPFRDDSAGPLVCDADPKGSIDPSPFVDPETGTGYLVWKSEGVPGSQPTGNLHEPAVDCVAWWQVTSGRNGRYQPAAGVSRAQMATFLAQAVLRSGGTLPAGRNAFRDDDGSVHEDNIDRLAAAGIVSGVDADSYAPDRPVSRAQMATFLARAAQHRTGTRLAAGADWFFDDEGSPHEGNVNAAAGEGLASGSGGGGYSPSGTVRRDQMASFLTRLLELYVEQENAPLPDGR